MAVKLNIGVTYRQSETINHIPLPTRKSYVSSTPAKTVRRFFRRPPEC